MNYPTRKEVQEAIATKTAQMHTQVGAKALADGHTQLLASNWFTCPACEAGLTATLGVAIAAALALFPEDTPAIAAIAAACGLSEAVVAAIFAGGTAGVSQIISQLCSAMDAC